MTLRIVRLGTPRLPREGTRIGAVRRPPRGVRKERYASDDWFDVWYPDLAPSAELMARGKAALTAEEWAAFARVPRRDEPADAKTDSRPPRRPLARCGFLDRLLLRRRGALPSLGAARASGGARRSPRAPDTPLCFAPPHVTRAAPGRRDGRAAVYVSRDGAFRWINPKAWAGDELTRIAGHRPRADRSTPRRNVRRSRRATFPDALR